MEDTTDNTIDNDGKILIFVRAYEKRGEGINAFIAYKIETQVSKIPGYTKNHFEVWRRFSDFLGLREKLVIKYQHKGIIVPYTPEKSISSLTKTKLTAGEEHSESADKRSRLLERFLRRIVLHPRLAADDDVRDFLSFEGDLPKANFTSTFSGNSVMKMFKSVGDAFTKIAFPMDENDRWFEQVHSQVEELEELMTRLQTHIDNLVSYRRELASADEQLSKTISLLASSEENTALAKTLSRLAETHERLSVVEKHESEQDAQQLAESFQSNENNTSKGDFTCEQLQLMSVLKEVFYERVKGWQNWQNQQQTLTKKRELKTRMELSGRGERISQCREDLRDSESKADEMEKDFLVMSKSIRDEYMRQVKQRREDLKQSIIGYLEALLESEQHTLEHWERFALEAKNQ
ncbi:PX domain-containing protein [Meloidogyne graminicola]|uniref:PX domain-containing protein n=1 Tax=Meloidogyne graminicola TaxID=189291 RepID=A0A8T0A2Y1_9BILA|nr:PX domain-containing protein [Meloidogyne graminicola]